MHWPRLRITIRLLMVLVALVALTVGVMKATQTRLMPSSAERQAEATYRQARLVREVAEYALKEYEAGIYLPARSDYLRQIANAQADLDWALDRLKWSTEVKGRNIKPELNHADGEPSGSELEVAHKRLEAEESQSRQKQLESLRKEIEIAKKDEQFRRKDWQAERSSRLWWGSGS